MLTALQILAMVQSPQLADRFITGGESVHCLTCCLGAPRRARLVRVKHSEWLASRRAIQLAQSPWALARVSQYAWVLG
jgi:hypothetical protein